MLSTATASAEIILIDVMALFATVTTVWALFYLCKRIFPEEFRQLQFFLTFIIVIVPLVTQFYFGVAALNYDSAAKVFGWPTALPLQSSPPLLLTLLIIYIGQTAWLWSRWRKVA